MNKNDKPPVSLEALARETLNIKVRQMAWEGDEDIMTANGKPVGGTINRNSEVDRWWPGLQEFLWHRVLSALHDATRERDAELARLRNLIAEAVANCETCGEEHDPDRRCARCRTFAAALKGEADGKDAHG